MENERRTLGFSSEELGKIAKDWERWREKQVEEVEKRIRDVVKDEKLTKLLPRPSDGKS